jgi:integrase
MSVRKRKWMTKGGERSGWLVTYTVGGKRKQATFKLQKDAKAFSDTTHVDIRRGTHIPDSDSTTVRAAGEMWISQAEAKELERTTTDQYRQHLDLHIAPFIGDMRLSELNVPAVRAFEDKLRKEGRSRAMVYKVIRSLGSLLADAQEQGLAAHNAVRDMSRGRKGGKQADARQKGRLEVGVDIPANDEIRAIVHALKGRWRPLVITAIFTGLRASELRGLAWANVDFKKRVLHVRQRADRYHKIGVPKTKSSNREIPLSPHTLNTLREWRLQCPKGELDLVFPNTRGNVEALSVIVTKGLAPAQIAAGVVTKDGKAKYTGMHKFRHFFASWCINREEDGGRGLPPKIVQELLGHSSIVMTLDVYGHLFPRADVTRELAKAERALLV